MSATTITFDAAQDTRLLAAFRDYFGVPGATALQVQAEYKKWIIRLSADIVRSFEDRVQKNALPSPASFDPS